jgi:hypothetical protein
MLKSGLLAYTLENYSDSRQSGPPDPTAAKRQDTSTYFASENSKGMTVMPGLLKPQLSARSSLDRHHMPSTDMP